MLDAAELDARSVLELFNAADAWRRPERFAELVTAALAGEPDADAARARLERARAAAAAVNAGEIAKAVEDAGRDPRQRGRGAAGGDPPRTDVTDSVTDAYDA